MSSKSLLRARAAALLMLISGCSSVMPWQNEPTNSEVNLAFTVEKNLLYLPNAEINGRRGRFYFASANARSVLDPGFAGALGGRPVTFQVSRKETFPISPIVLDLAGVGDALIGADAWDSRAVTIDYRVGLLTYQKEGIHPAYMTLFSYKGEPAITIHVDGRSIAAVVDTALPDSLVLPEPSKRGRATAHVVVAGTDFGAIDVAHRDVAQARIGNRLLSKFLVSIDYGRRQVGLWRDPRIRM